MTERAKRTSERIYQRWLPGGGFVCIEVTSTQSQKGTRYRGDVLVERRVELARREGHTPPTIGSTEAATIAGVFHDLFPLANSNAAIAAECVARAQKRPTS